MNELEKEAFVRIKKDFSKVKRKRKLSAQDADKLVIRVTELLGIYAMDFDKELAQLIEEMISFGEQKKWSLAGSKYQLDKLNKRYGV